MQISLNTISFASRHMGYNIILLQATGAFFTKQERANETRTLQNTSNMFQRHIHVDVAVKLNRCALTRTIFERTSGTSYLKFNLDIIAYRIFFILSLACGSEPKFPSFFSSHFDDGTNELCVRFF